MHQQASAKPMTEEKQQGLETQCKIYSRLIIIEALATMKIRRLCPRIQSELRIRPSPSWRSHLCSLPLPTPLGAWVMAKGYLLEVE